MDKIQVDQLKAKAALGLQIKRFNLDDTFEEKSDALGPHRDDHYIFFLLTEGCGAMTLDFQPVQINAPQLFYILPGQLHQHIKTAGAAGWFIATEAALLPPVCRDVFENIFSVQVPHSPGPAALKQFTSLLGLLEEKHGRQNAGIFQRPLVFSLLESFLIMAAEAYNANITTAAVPRAAAIAREFKAQLAKNFRNIKKPAGYAKMLHVSVPHLNETLKKLTGFPVSFWIQQQVLAEAKRLLYYTDLSVKQIAWELGYEDYAYFSRYFHKASGMAPVAFREHYQDNA